MIKFLLFFLFLTPINLFTQNCEAFKYYGDTLQYEACKYIQNTKRHYQFSREYQEKYDKAIKICPYFSTAFHAKSVAYLKSGDFLTWKTLIDKAVEFNPTGYLGYRGWCRYQFFRDYKGAIDDFEHLDSLANHNIGYSASGEYQLNIAKAICYKAIGQNTKAIEIIEKQLNDNDHVVGMYDYFHLGVMYIEVKKFKKAIDILTLQIQENELADVHFYIALCHKELNEIELYIRHLELAKKMYLEGKKAFDAYTHIHDKVYLKEIEEELKMAKSM